MKKIILFPVLIFIVTVFFVQSMQSCAVIIPPGGGPKDTLPPNLISASPKDSALRFKGNKIVLTFNEFVEAKDMQQNLIVWPNLKHLPAVDYKLREVTVKLKDSLEPNTTYTLNFGNSIKDVNEGNIAKNFSYIFSTGNYIDSGYLQGKVILAENGKIDSTLIVVLQQDLSDTAIIKKSPRYYTKLDREGNFYFENLPYGKFAVYAVENSYGKRYDDSTRLFAFLDSSVYVQDDTGDITLYAFQQAKKKEKNAATTTNAAAVSKNKNNKQLAKDIKAKLDIQSGKQSLLLPLTISFSKKYTATDTSKIILCDTLYKKLNNYSFELDTLQEKIFIKYSWKENQKLNVVLIKGAVADSAGNTLSKNDTLRFITQKESEYGSLRFRLNNVDTLKKQVLQIISGEKIIQSVPVTNRDFYMKLFIPDTYELRVLYDKNKNGKWDTGNYKQKLQPEIVKDLHKKITIKADRDNEFEVNL